MTANWRWLAYASAILFGVSIGLLLPMVDPNVTTPPPPSPPRVEVVAADASSISVPSPSDRIPIWPLEIAVTQLYAGGEAEAAISAVRPTIGLSCQTGRLVSVYFDGLPVDVATPNVVVSLAVGAAEPRRVELMLATDAVWNSEGVWLLSDARVRQAVARGVFAGDKITMSYVAGPGSDEAIVWHSERLKLYDASRIEEARAMCPVSP